MPTLHLTRDGSFSPASSRRASDTCMRSRSKRRSMNKRPSVLLALLPLALFATLRAAQKPAEPPREWIDPDTGHRVVRLSEEPGSQSLYFHQNAYTPDGAKLVVTTPTGLATIDLKTGAIVKVVESRVNLIMTGRKTGQAYYVRTGTVYAVDLGTKVSREVAKLPSRGSVATVNADETLLAGTITEGAVPGAAESQGRDSYPGKG